MIAKIVWSDIISRFQWRNASINASILADIKQVESKRKRINRIGRETVCQFEGVHFITHDINYTKPELYLRDGVHLSIEETDILIKTFTEALASFSKHDAQKHCSKQYNLGENYLYINITYHHLSCLRNVVAEILALCD